MQAEVKAEGEAEVKAEAEREAERAAAMQAEAEADRLAEAEVKAKAEAEVKAELDVKYLVGTCLTSIRKHRAVLAGKSWLLPPQLTLQPLPAWLSAGWLSDGRRQQDSGSSSAASACQRERIRE